MVFVMIGVLGLSGLVYTIPVVDESDISPDFIDNWKDNIGAIYDDDYDIHEENKRSLGSFRPRYIFQSL